MKKCIIFCKIFNGSYQENRLVLNMFNFKWESCDSMHMLLNVRSLCDDAKDDLDDVMPE